MQISEHIKDFLFKHKFKLVSNNSDFYKNESLTAVVQNFDSRSVLKIYITKNPEIFICISMNTIIETEILSVMIRKLFIQN